MNWGDPTINWKEKILQGESKEIIEILEEIFLGIIGVKRPKNFLAQWEGKHVQDMTWIFKEEIGWVRRPLH